MIVEFYGLPGSGKTTLSKRLAQKNPQRFIYLHTSSRGEIIKYGLLFFLFHPGMFIFWLKELFVESQRKHFSQLFRYKLHLLLITIVQYQKAKNYPKKTVLLDEGLFQRILAIYDRKIDSKKIEKCFANIPKINLLVICQNPETEFFRFKNSVYREESPRVKLGEEYFKNWQDLVRENDKLIREKIKEKGMRFINVNNIEELEKYLSLYHNEF